MSCVWPMPDQSDRSSKDVLEPQERVSEALFGLIMVLTFTGSLSIAEANDGDVRTMLIGALGCNLAWGIIDGIFFLMGCLSEQAKGMRAWRAARNARARGSLQQLWVRWPQRLLGFPAVLLTPGPRWPGFGSDHDTRRRS